MADFLSRLAARTLGVAPLARPSIASMFAQRPAQAERYPSELWSESEHLAAPTLQPGISMQTDVSGGQAQDTVPTTLSPSPVLQSELSTDVLEQPPGGSEGASAKIKTAHSQQAVFDTATSEHTRFVPSPLVTGRTHPVTSIPEAHPTLREDVVSMYPDFPSAHPLHSTEHTSFQSERHMARNSAGELRSRPIRTLLAGNDTVSGAIESHEITSEHPQGTLIQQGSRSSRHHHGFNKGMNETIVRQERNISVQSADSLSIQAGHDLRTQLIAPSHPDASNTYPPATLPQRSASNTYPLATLPQRSILPEAIRSQSHVSNGQHAEAQVIEVSSPEPTISVTIGRIEVRATPPPPAQPESQRRSTPPIMSLDQYLQGRSQGGER